MFKTIAVCILSILGTLAYSEVGTVRVCSGNPISWVFPVVILTYSLSFLALGYLIAYEGELEW